MKDSKIYSPKIMKLFRSLKRKGTKTEPVHYNDPVEAIVHGLVNEYLPAASASRTLKRMEKHFIDLNDLRVSRKEEILDIFKDQSESADKTARSISLTLNSIFQKYDKVKLDFLKEEGKRQARKELEEIEGISFYAANYCFMTAMGGHAVPLNAKMLEYLRSHDLVHPEATDQEIAGFLERQIAASDGYLFHLLLREEAENNTSAADDATAPPKTKKKKKVTKKKSVSKK